MAQKYAAQKLRFFSGSGLKFETPADKDYHGVEYYEAVIADGIDNMTEFEKWILEHRKKPMYYWIP